MRAAANTTKRKVHHVYIHGVRVALSHAGRSVPQWLATAAADRFPLGCAVEINQVQRFMREQFPQGSCVERDEVASKLARAMRRAAAKACGNTGAVSLSS